MKTEIEVSAIMEGNDDWHPLAITPDGRVFVWSDKQSYWEPMFHPFHSGLQYWNLRAYHGLNERRIWRGIFKIKVVE